MAASLDETMSIASVYAEALFSLAQEAGTIDATLVELDALVQLTEDDSKFAEFLRSVAIDPDARAASLEKIFRGRLSDLTVNALLVLNAHGRAGVLSQVRRAFVLAAEQSRNQIEATAISAVELEASAKQRIKELVAEKTGKEPLVSFDVDPDVLGGVVLRIADWQFDGSLRKQLKEMRSQLMERGERGLAVSIAD